MHHIFSVSNASSVVYDCYEKHEETEKEKYLRKVALEKINESILYFESHHKF